MDKKRELEFKKQRKKRGFDDTELWALDWTIAKFVYPRIKAFRKNFCPKPDPNDKKAIGTIIVEIEWALKTIAESKGGDFIHPDGLSDKEVKVFYKRLNKGLKLYGENFRRLWY